VIAIVRFCFIIYKTSPKSAHLCTIQDYKVDVRKCFIPHSASPVLTATHHSYGSPRLSDFFPSRLWRSHPQPILTTNGSNDMDSRKDVPFAVKIATFHTP